MGVPLRIVCDRNMPFAAEAFGGLGEVVLLDGRAIGPADVREADVLATRSTTSVNRALLEGSRVRFYGTATIGFDHVDTRYLEQRGIPWTAAPGCNAESVAQYFTSALLALARRENRAPTRLKLGVVGVGNVGKRVVAKAKALGMRVLATDPPRRRDPSDAEARAFVPLASLLSEADVVTLHVPLNREGADRTLDMVDDAFLGRMKPGAWLFNAARGELLDADALLRALNSGRIGHAVIDTWRDEPRFSRDLLERVAFGTPHIAGHSYEGKVNGTLMVYRAVCRFLGREPDWTPVLPSPPLPAWSFDAIDPAAIAPVEALVRATYDIAADDRRLREASSGAREADAASAFDQLRKHYPMRREFAATRVDVSSAAPLWRKILKDLDFTLC